MEDLHNTVDCDIHLIKHFIFSAVYTVHHDSFSCPSCLKKILYHLVIEYVPLATIHNQFQVHWKKFSFSARTKLRICFMWRTTQWNSVLTNRWFHGAHKPALIFRLVLVYWSGKVLVIVINYFVYIKFLYSVRYMRGLIRNDDANLKI